MLRGSHRATVDEKGRVKIPADFLAELRRQGRQFYVTSERGDCAKVYPMKFWSEIERKLARLSSHNRAKQKFLHRTNYYGQVVELDAQGRLLIPAVLRDAADARGEVTVVGQLTHIEVWSHARYLEQMNNNPMTADDDKLLDDLGI